MIYDTLKNLVDNKRKQPMHIYPDETDGKIKERPLKLDSAGATMNKQVNVAKEIHKFMFGF